jgi:hypothetical protein
MIPRIFFTFAIVILLMQIFVASSFASVDFELEYLGRALGNGEDTYKVKLYFEDETFQRYWMSFDNKHGKRFNLSESDVVNGYAEAIITLPFLEGDVEVVLEKDRWSIFDTVMSKKTVNLTALKAVVPPPVTPPPDGSPPIPVGAISIDAPTCEWTFEGMTTTCFKNLGDRAVVFLIALGVLSSVFLLPYIGMLWASGNPDNIQKATEMLVAWASGLLLLLLSGFIIEMVGRDVLGFL